MAEPTREAISNPSTTPRPSTAPTQTPKPLEEAATPTRASFGAGALASQKPLPSNPFPESVQVPESTTSTAATTASATTTATATAAATTTTTTTTTRAKRENPQQDDSDGEGHGAEEGAGSDDDSVNTDGTRSKKKKSQRFYCTDYPPCNLSFTRSEHLARHIRKHTGERPFQCHCSRRFSRLDNLRQHAQTVHVNEEIPIDSLAATGTRFQRQIRTDRVRQTGRARASTGGSVGPGGRGHAKSLSTSSIASASSIASTYSVNEARRRPPPLVMADPRSRIPIEPYRAPDGQLYRPPSPSDFSTPTSATFSTGQNSPRWGPIMSPGSSHTRSQSMYVAGSRTPGRRLSVPSGGNPFQSPHGPGSRGPLLGPGGFSPTTSSTFSPSQSSLLSSPTASASTWSRRDSMSLAADEAWRRRTWHPDTRDYSGASRLSQVVTPSQIPPDTVSLPPPNVGNQPPQPVRLPGIESFDGFRPVSPPPRRPSPMMIDSNNANPPALLPGDDLGPDDRQSAAAQWDANLRRGLNRLDINTPPRDTAGAWANEANQALLARADQARAAPIQPTVRFEPDVRRVQPAPPTPIVPAAHGSTAPVPSIRHQHTMSAPSASVLHDSSRRHEWYGTAGHPVRETIHENRAAHIDRMVHPNMSAFQGFPAREDQARHQNRQLQQQPQQHPQQQPQAVVHYQPAPERGGPPAAPDQGPKGNSNNSTESMRRLEALVAVAACENSVATAY